MQKSKNDKAEELIVKIRRGDTLYGLEGGSVRELLKLPKVTPVPRQPRFLRGIFNFKGSIVPVISMAALCGADTAEHEPLCILLTVGEKVYGLSVEDVSEMEYDGGNELKMQSATTQNGVLIIKKVLDGAQPIFVLDSDKMMESLEG